MWQRTKSAFTLLELLVVVAIIIILAAIAIPNFLEAQTRAKVSRSRADLRTVATALEAFSIDNNKYPPNDGLYNVIPIQLSTPIAYITSTNLIDTFNDKERHPIYGELARFYTYTRIVGISEFQSGSLGTEAPPNEAVDGPGFNRGALGRYGPWRLLSHGPDRIYNKAGIPAGPFNPNANVLLGADIPYDPSNGTVSFGNVLRTHKSPEGLAP